MANLFPENYETETVELSELVNDTVIGYKNGVAFDDDTGDFIRNGKNVVVDNTGIESWKNWYVNCMSTQRYSCLAYSTDFGIDIAAIFSAPTREEAEAVAMKEITDASMADPYGRTEYLSDFVFEWVTPEGVKISLKVHGIDDVTIDVTVYITNAQ